MEAMLAASAVALAAVAIPWVAEPAGAEGNAKAWSVLSQSNHARAKYRQHNKNQ
jgi:hypothetical protein